MSSVPRAVLTHALAALAPAAVAATVLVTVHEQAGTALQVRPAAADLAVAQAIHPTVPVVRKPIPTMPVARSDAAETVAAARASAYNVPGQCLGWSREQADIPSRYATAAIAWEHAAQRHPGDFGPPRGAAVYWTGGSAGAGHIAISLGNGLVRSSDAGGYGVVGTISIRELTREWHLEYAGWADSINGYRIPGVVGA